MGSLEKKMSAFASACNSTMCVSLSPRCVKFVRTRARREFYLNNSMMDTKKCRSAKNGIEKIIAKRLKILLLQLVDEIFWRYAHLVGLAWMMTCSNEARRHAARNSVHQTPAK